MKYYTKYQTIKKKIKLTWIKSQKGNNIKEYLWEQLVNIANVKFKSLKL